MEGNQIRLGGVAFFAAFSLFVLLAWLVLVDPAFAQADPLSGVTDKVTEAEDSARTLALAAVGLAGVIVLGLVAFGKISWYWIGSIVVAGAALSGWETIKNWLAG